MCVCNAFDLLKPLSLSFSKSRDVLRFVLVLKKKNSQYFIFLLVVSSIRPTQSCCCKVSMTRLALNIRGAGLIKKI